MHIYYNYSIAKRGKRMDMEELSERVKSIAELRLLNQEVRDPIRMLQRQYGVTAVRRAIRESGFWSVLGNFVDGREEKRNE